MGIDYNRSPTVYIKLGSENIATASEATASMNTTNVEAAGIDNGLGLSPGLKGDDDTQRMSYKKW